MAKESIYKLLQQKVHVLVEKQYLPSKYEPILLGFLQDYQQAVLEEKDLESFETFLSLLEKHHKDPPQFSDYHQKVLSPFNYYQFGLDFIRPLIDFSHSKFFGKENIQTMAQQLSQKENVILLANHQTESDPQILALFLEKKYPEMAKKMIFIAGERVITDPTAIPFSLGCDLLCIYSKKYIDCFAEKKQGRLTHNRRVMQKMSELLQEGGKIIYVAPSGGRDRPDKTGTVRISKFDPDSIELFYLMAKRAKTPTHFYPLTLATYPILPPPDTLNKELGEARKTSRAPVGIAFSQEIDMQHFPGYDSMTKAKLRLSRAIYIQNIVEGDYQKLI